MNGSAIRTLCRFSSGMPESGGMVGTFIPCPFKRRTMGTEVPFHNNIIGNFMVYQYRLETNLL